MTMNLNPDEIIAIGSLVICLIVIWFFWPFGSKDYTNHWPWW